MGEEERRRCCALGGCGCSGGSQLRALQEYFCARCSEPRRAWEVPENRLCDECLAIASREAAEREEEQRVRTSGSEPRPLREHTVVILGMDVDHPEPPPCTLPPPGWRCTRGAGHRGPCAAVPDREDS
jgi:hypothetical protein